MVADPHQAKNSKNGAPNHAAPHACLRDQKRPQNANSATATTTAAHSQQEAQVIAELTAAVREQMHTANVELAKTIVAAKLAQTLARTELIKTAQGLLGKARKLAETGRPRLLAVISKIILDRHLQFNPKIPQPRRAAAPPTLQ